MLQCVLCGDSGTSWGRPGSATAKRQCGAQAVAGHRATGVLLSLACFSVLCAGPVASHTRSLRSTGQEQRSRVWESAVGCAAFLQRLLPTLTELSHA